MRHGLLLLMAGAGVGFGAGCSGDPPPIVEAKPVGGEKPVTVAFLPPAKPTASEPAAAKLIADALAAHTGKDLSKLDKLKSATVTRIGRTTTQDGLRAPLECSLDLRGPDCRAVLTITRPEGQFKNTILLTAKQNTYTGPMGQTADLDEDTLRDVRSQKAEDELLLLFPLADPTTVAASAPDATVNGKPAAGAYAWTPALARAALVHFDKASGRLVRLVYIGRERSTEVLKEVTVHEHREFGGVWLSSRYLLRIKGMEFLDVEKQTYEVGKTFPAGHFEK